MKAYFCTVFEENAIILTSGARWIAYLGTIENEVTIDPTTIDEIVASFCDDDLNDEDFETIYAIGTPDPAIRYGRDLEMILPADAVEIYDSDTLMRGEEDENEPRWLITDEEIEKNLATWGADDFELYGMTWTDLSRGSLAEDESLLGERFELGRNFRQIVSAYLAAAHRIGEEAMA